MREPSSDRSGGRYLESSGARVYYEVAGSGSTTVLLTHGFGETSQTWDSQVRAVAARYRLVTWDLRGHGATSTPDTETAYTQEASVADMVALLDAVGARRAVVGGLSLGGYLSLAFALAHPGRVEGLLLFNTGPGYRDESARAAWNAYAERIAQRCEMEFKHDLARAARGILKQTSSEVIGSLPAIRVPTLVLVGRDDQPYQGAADYMAARIPGASKVVIEGAGHHPNTEQAGAFNGAVVEFLSSLLATDHTPMSAIPRDAGSGLD